MDRKTLYSFAMQVAKFKIPKSEDRKCSMSFFGFARELTTKRLEIKDKLEGKAFDLQVKFVITQRWISDRNRNTN